MREPRTLSVGLALLPHGTTDVGRIALDRGTALLEYAGAFMETGLAVNPLFARPSGELVRAREPRLFDGLHGVFADSLPDAWGMELIRRRLRAAGVSLVDVTALEKLAIVGARGPGALTYRPASHAGAPFAGELDLDRLATESLAILNHEESDCAALLERLGGSSGGARPKISVALAPDGSVRASDDTDPDSPAWLVKFRGRTDPVDIGPLEAAYADMARAAGIAISETRLIGTAAGPGYFATRRFDRLANGVRPHMLSVAGMLELDWSTPSLDYDQLLRLVLRVTRDHTAVEQMFARMVFNVLAHNRDDHTKQHAFVMSSDGRWNLAPAYDLTFSAGPGGEHYLAVDGVGRDVSRANVEALAERHGITVARRTAIVRRIGNTVAAFRLFAAAYDVVEARRTEIQHVLARTRAAFEKGRP